MSGVQVNGLLELGEALQQFPQVLAKKHLRRATYQAALSIKDDAVSRAPVRTGNLRANIATFVRKTGGLNAHYVIGVRKIKLSRKIKRVFRILRKAGYGRTNIEEDAYYWRFIELGTSKISAKPFLRPAFESQKEAAIDRFKTVLSDGVQETASEVSRG